MDLSGRTALVTGAGRRLGRAIAAALAGRGMRIAIHHHISTDGAAELEADIRSAGGEAVSFNADLSDPSAARDLPGRVADVFGGLDVLINSAAVFHRLDFEHTTPAQYDAIMGVNLRAAFFCGQGAAPFLRRSRGKVVNLADLAGLEPWPAFAAHSISKAGVVMLTKVMARALAPDVTVNAIAPGAVLVPDAYDEAERDRLARSTPLGRLGQPADVTDAVLYLLESGDFVTGEVLVVDGGRHLR